ncbi:MAG: tetratricopeptide repeat protein [Solirubrobacteraceae bacterium]
MNRARIACVGALLLASCATQVDPVAEFTTGTAALDAGDFPEAIAHLEKAVALQPNVSTNQNNLASAYLAAGRVRDGWPHVRRAVALDPGDLYSVANCRVFFVKMREETQLANGDSSDVLREKLGEPDEVRNEDGKTSWRYCLIAVQIRDGAIAGAVDLPVPAKP